MKISVVALNNWRELQIAFRKADNKRSGVLSKLDFMGILADFNVSLDNSELNFLMSQYGGGRKKVSSSFRDLVASLGRAVGFQEQHQD